jgi:dTMP kinase
MKRGKLIVIDGTDGSGKATQTVILARRLRQDGYSVVVEDFPQYGKKSAGPVEDYLNGSYGPAHAVGPYLPSIFYAVDRFAASERIRKSLAGGKIVICNRYVTANLAHQGGKISSPRKRERFFRWVIDLEYRLFRLPRPDLNLILHMPAVVAQKLVGKKATRVYLRGKKRDIHEKDLGHLRAAERVYLEIAKRFGYPVVECYVRGRILSRAEVASLIRNAIKKHLRV